MSATEVNQVNGVTMVVITEPDGSEAVVTVAQDGKMLDRRRIFSDPSTGAEVTVFRAFDGRTNRQDDFPDRTVAVLTRPDGTQLREETFFEKPDDRTSIMRKEIDGVETFRGTTMVDGGTTVITEERSGAAPEVKTIRESTEADGSFVTDVTVANGTARSVSHTDGRFTSESTLDGVVLTNSSVPRPDGGYTLTTVTDGKVSVSTVSFEGGKMRQTVSEDGEPELVIVSDRTVERTPDGRTVTRFTIEGPGDERSVDTSGPGEARSFFHRGADGTEARGSTTFDANGVRIDEEELADGTGFVSRQFVEPDGTHRTETQNRDGTLTSQRIAPDGTVTTRTSRPDNAVEERVLRPDGSGSERITDRDGITTDAILDADPPRPRGVELDDDLPIGAGAIADDARPEPGVRQATGETDVVIDNPDGSTTEVTVLPTGVVSRTTTWDDPDTGAHVVRTRTSEGMESFVSTTDDREVTFLAFPDGSVAVVESITTRQADGTVVVVTTGDDVTERVTTSTPPEGGTLVETVVSVPGRPDQVEVRNTFVGEDGGSVSELVDEHGIFREVVRPDGTAERTLVLPDGNVIHRDTTLGPDGSLVTRTYDDSGTIEVERKLTLPDGERTSTSTLGGPEEVVTVTRLTSVDENGAEIRSETTVGPGNARIDETFGPGEDHARTTTDQNGAKTTTTTTFDAEGTRVDRETFPDGRQRVIDSSVDEDGDLQTVITEPDGSTVVHTVDPDGTAHSRVNHPDGSFEERTVEADGSGSTVKINPDGNGETRTLEADPPIDQLPDVDPIPPVDPSVPPPDVVPPTPPTPAPDVVPGRSASSSSRRSSTRSRRSTTTCSNEAGRPS